MLMCVTVAQLLMGLADLVGTHPQGQSLHQFVEQAHRCHFV